jgi:hypothetical protein
MNSIKINIPNLIVISTLYLVGISFLFYFFTFSFPAVGNGDWLKEYNYLNVTRGAIEELSIPWKYGINNFLSNPEIIFFPDLVLLPILSNTQYIFLHSAIFYTLGITGIYFLSVGWSPLAQFFCWILFTFNGFVLSHLAAGHFQFIGYFAFPLVFWLVSNFQKESSYKWYFYPTLLSFVLAALFLNGSLHAAIWMCLFILLAAIFDLETFLKSIFSIGMAGGIALFKLVPAAAYDNRASAFVTGYPNVEVFINALTTQASKNTAIGTNIGLLNWYEYDAYIGFVGLLFVLLFSIKDIRSDSPIFSQNIVFAALFMAILSIGNVYELITFIPESIAKVERITTRFISVPLVLFIIIAANGLNNFFTEKFNSAKKLFILLLLPFLCYEIYSHLQQFRLPLRVSREFQAPIYEILAFTTNDMEYKALYLRYSMISGFFFIISLFMISRAKKRAS